MASANDLRQQSKWITGVDPQMPASEAGAKIVGIRLARLAEVIPLARDRAEEDPEHIHQLRVSSRRADAALEAFRPCFGKKRWKKMETRVRRIRRAAGSARSCDVQIQHLAERRPSTEPALIPALEQAIQMAIAERMAAQRKVAKVADRYPPKKLEAKIAKLLKGVRSTSAKRFHRNMALSESRDSVPSQSRSEHRCDNENITFQEVAVFELPRLVRNVAAAADRDLGAFEHLHELRLEAKQLRYAIEIFASCFPKAVASSVYPKVKAMQDRLGDINDCHELALLTGRYAQQAAGTSSEDIVRGLQRLSVTFRDQRDQLRRDFLDWWHNGSGSEVVRSFDVIAVPDQVENEQPPDVRPARVEPDAIVVGEKG